MHAPLGCQLTDDHGTKKKKKKKKKKNVTIPKGGLHVRSWQPIWDISASGPAALHETGGLSATLVVNRLGRCRATRAQQFPVGSERPSSRGFFTH